MSRSRAATPLGRLVTGDEFYAPIGRMNYDGDRVQCHLCGRWLKMVGGVHLLSAHDLTLDEYRDMFQLHKNVSPAAPQTSERKRSTMLAQISSGQRDQSVLVNPSAPTVGR